MKEHLLDLLICPACLPRERSLSCDILESRRGDIVSGTLSCAGCGAVYPVEDGIASLVPSATGSTGRHPHTYEEPALVSSYLWSHYADIFGDSDAGGAYREWAELVGVGPGPALDTGCAVGRFTYELSGKNDFAVGIDNSRAFISRARELMTGRTTTFPLLEEGRIHEEVTIELPEDIDTDKVEFILGDAQALPFRSGTFSTLSSLNLIDKIPSPSAHLKEADRAARRQGAQILFSDPFSWSADTAQPEEWLGGTTEGPFAGRGLENVRSLLAGERQMMTTPWNIEKTGRVWWRIRHHRNRFELIRSCYIRAVR